MASRGQLVVGEKRLLDQALQHVERLGQVFVERIEGDKGMLRCAREVEPRTIVIQPLGYLGGSIAVCAFAQHAVGEQRLQGLALMPTAACHQDVDAHHLVIACIEHIEGDSVGQCYSFGRLHLQVFRLFYFGLESSVYHFLN